MLAMPQRPPWHRQINIRKSLTVDRSRCRCQHFYAPNPCGLPFMQKPLAIAAIALAVSGCAVAPPPARLLAPADGRARVPAFHATDASAGTLTFRPVGPTGWGEAQPEAAPKAEAPSKAKAAKP